MITSPFKERDGPWGLGSESTTVDTTDGTIFSAGLNVVRNVKDVLNLKYGAFCATFRLGLVLDPSVVRGATR